MANWQKEIMILANDFCLNMAKAKEIVLAIDKITVPQGKSEADYFELETICHQFKTFFFKPLFQFIPVFSSIHTISKHLTHIHN